MGMPALTYSYEPVINFILTLFGLPDETSFPFLFSCLFTGLTALSMIVFLAHSLSKNRKLLHGKQLLLDLLNAEKSELEFKNKNLTDSLIYAKRIQEALLPSENYFRKHFEDSFILFKPKDIVSGDFYWIGEKGDNVFVVAADCTGHGVPGALMSMIGIEIIGKAINESNIETPSLILAVLNRALEKTFKSGKNIGTIIRDGMDIGLCRIDKVQKKMIYSGAFFPLYLIRDNSLTEIKGDKLIIGLNPEAISYTDHEIDLLENDIFYIFSDGFVDQFGGSENKKFMYRRFRYLLTKIHSFSFEDQKAILEEEFRGWMGNNVQVDDIMVIGFRPLS
jgi:serine phosphatase RsbU (regulator of sigma subunit)